MIRKIQRNLHFSYIKVSNSNITKLLLFNRNNKKYNIHSILQKKRKKKEKSLQEEIGKSIKVQIGC